jgi:hypothetical protein
MTSSRRDFLKHTVASLALLVGGAPWWLAPRHAVAGELPTRMVTPAGREFIMMCDTQKDVFGLNLPIRVTHPGTVKGLDVASGESFAIDLDFFGHTVTQNPMQPHQVVTFEKWGKRGALIDLHDRSIITTSEASENNVFFGHAAFNADGSILVTSEDTYDRNSGQLVWRNASDLKVIHKSSSYGGFPHECMTPDHGKTLMVANEGDYRVPTPSSLVWLDMASGRLLNRVEFARPDGGFAHLDISADNWVCLAGIKTGKNMRGVVILVSPEGRVMRPEIPDDLVARMKKKEALSVAFLGSSGLVAISLPSANLIVVLDYKKQVVAGVITAALPQGLLPSLTDLTGRSMIATSYHDKNLIEASVGLDGQTSSTVFNAQFKAYP